MVWRKWLVRCLVFTVTGSVALAAGIYQHCTNPVAVREQVLARLEEHLPGAQARVESAHLVLLGGISFQDLYFFRRDDRQQTPFLSVPSGNIQHDKEQLLDGKVAIRKIEFYKPCLRVVREKNGSWNVQGILGKPDLTKSIPTIILKQATVFVADNRNSPDTAPLEIKDVSLSIVNDPISKLSFKGNGICTTLGPVGISGKLGRASDEFALSLQLQSFPVGGELVQRLAAYQPEAADHLRELTGVGKLSAKLFFSPKRQPAWTYALHGKLTEGRFTQGCARALCASDRIEGVASVIDGQLTVEKLAPPITATRPSS